MKSETPIVSHTAAQKKYIEALPIPGRQGSYNYKPVRRLNNFNVKDLPKNLFNSMDNIAVYNKPMSLKDLCGMSCINIQRDVELHKYKLLQHLVTDDNNLSTMSEIHLAYIRNTKEYLIVNGNTRLSLCRDELIREISENKIRRFKIPEYFNASIHEFDTQEEAEIAYNSYDNRNAVESQMQKLQGASYALDHESWLSHPILKHCSYFNVMQKLLGLVGVSRADKLTVFDLVDFFHDDLMHLEKTFNYELGKHASSRFIMAYLGLRLGYRNEPEMFDKIDKFYTNLPPIMLLNKA